MFSFEQNRIKVLHQVCELLATEQDELQKTARGIATGTLCVAVGTIIGGLLGGKTGMLAGGGIGVAASQAMTTDFKSVLEIWEEMPKIKKDEVLKQINRLLRGLDILSADDVMNYLATNTSLKDKIIEIMTK